MQNNTDLINTLRIMRNRHLINLVNNKNSNKKDFLVYLIDEKPDID